MSDDPNADNPDGWNVMGFEPKNMAHPNMHVTFAHLRDVLQTHKGWKVRMNIFDCGHYVEVEDTVLQTRIVARTWRCDDTGQDAPSQIAQWLVDTGRLKVVDFG